MRLPKMKIQAFLDRMGYKQKDLAEKVNGSVSLVGGWCVSRVYPSYEKIAELLVLGMSIEELFGPEVAEKTKLFSDSSKESSHTINRDAFLQGVKEALAELAKTPKIPESNK